MSNVNSNPSTETLYIVMPAYNEAENLPHVIGRWYNCLRLAGPDSRLVILDDGSRDNTPEIMGELTELYPQLRYERRENAGHGTACLRVYRLALQEGADWVFQTDSDDQTDPEEFQTFWEARENYDFVIGNRRGRQDGWSRVLVTNVLRLVVRLRLRASVPDANCPFRLMRAEALAKCLETIPEEFFLSNVLISATAVRRKFRIAWLPITFAPRRRGKNSINIPRIFRIGRRSWRELGQARRQLDLALAREAGD